MWTPSSYIARKVPVSSSETGGVRWRDEHGVGPLGMHRPQQGMLLVHVIGPCGHGVDEGAAKNAPPPDQPRYAPGVG
jgi:hypothetical protein